MAYTLGGSGSLHPEVEAEEIEQESAMSLATQPEVAAPYGATVTGYLPVDFSAKFHSVVSQG